MYVPRVMIAGIIIGISLFVAVTLPSAVSAEQVTRSWSWGPVTPSTFSSKTISDAHSASLCRFSYRPRQIEGDFRSRQVCQHSSGNVRFGNYYLPGAGFPHVIGFGNDSKMYQIFGSPCATYNSCLYVEATDMLVVRQLTGPSGTQLAIYKDFSKQLSIGVFGPLIIYNFDGISPDYRFTDNRNISWDIGSVGASPNGEWLAVEFPGRALGILNLKTMVMKRFSTASGAPGTGRDATTEFAVSNDGRTVAMAGQNAGLTVWTINEACADDMTFLHLSNIMPMATPCRESPMPTILLMNQFQTAVHPRLNEEGSELSFYAWSRTGEQREFILRANGYNPPRVELMALGDSYISGEGEINDAFYQPNTNTGIDKCHVSVRSYPFLIAQTLGIERDYVKSFACSGAKMTDVVSENDEYWGQRGRLSTLDPQPDPSQKTIIQTNAREREIPGRISQKSFAEYYRPGIILLGIGGNDAGLIEKLKACLMPDECRFAGTAQGREQTALEIKQLFKQLADTYTKLHEANPRAQIYTVGYPHIIDAGGTCGLLHGLLLSGSEKRFMVESIAYLNKVIEAASVAAGVRYIDIQDSFGDKVLCGSGAPTVMNAITLGDDYGPLPFIKLIGQEAFHPTPSGHALTANRITTVLPSIQTYNYCNEFLGMVDTVCPVFNNQVPEPSAYWLQGGITHGYPAQRHVDIGSPDMVYEPGSTVRILLADYSVAPGESVSTELHSTPTALESAVSTALGGLDMTVTIPAGTSAGYHALHIIGKSYSGESIDLYSVINISPLQVPTIGRDVTQAASPTQSELSTTPSRTAREPTVAQAAIANQAESPDSAVLGSSDVTPPLAQKTVAATWQGSSTFEVAWLFAPLVVLASIFIFVAKRRRNTH